MNRIDWLVEKFGRTLLTVAVFIHGETFPSARCAVEEILKADPTPNKKFARWLVDAYMRGDYLTEDCEKAQETLKLFQVHSRLLDAKDRDIGQHRSVADIWKLVRQFVEAPDEAATGKELRRAERNRARRESLILLDEAENVVAVPLTRFAAIWWGRGTRWCTSMEHTDHFSNYQKAPLFVIISNGAKFQAYPYKGSVTFMDDNDAPISNADRERLKEGVPELMDWLARECNDPELMPEDRMDHEFLLAAIRENGQAIRYLLPHLLNKELYMEAINSYPAAIAIIPEEFIDAQMCMLAVQLDGLCFPYLPARFHTQDFLMTAMQDWGYLLDFIPEDERTRENCEKAICTGVVNLESIPAKFWDEELAVMVMKHVNDSLEFIRDHRPEFMSEALDSILSQGSRNSFPTWAQPGVVTHELCVIAVRNHKYAWIDVPFEMRTHEVVRALMSRGGDHGFDLRGGRNERPAARAVRQVWNESAKKVAAVKGIFANRSAKADR
jgi:hypothetical protein